MTKFNLNTTSFKIIIVSAISLFILVIHYYASNITPQLKSYDVPSNETYKINRISDEDFLAKIQDGTLDEIKQYLLLGANPNAVDNNHRNALSIAALFNPDPNLAKLLIKHHVKLNAKDKNGYDALMLSAITGGNNLDFTNILVKAKINTNAINNAHSSTLMVAAGSSTNPKLLQQIIKAGAKVNYRNHEKVTPLMVAAKITTNPKIIETLLAYGANPHARDSLNITVYEIAKSNPALRNNKALMNKLR